VKFKLLFQGRYEASKATDIVCYCKAFATKQMA